VRTCLDRRIIAPCDPHIGSARIKRADRRPREWGLDLTLVREDVADEHACGPEHHPPARGRQPTGQRRPGYDGHSNGGRSPHPAAEPVANPAGEVRLLHPEAGMGCSQRSGGVRPAQSRGAAAAPEPSEKPSTELPAASARAREAPAGREADGCSPVSEFFTVLGDG